MGDFTITPSLGQRRLIACMEEKELPAEGCSGISTAPYALALDCSANGLKHH